LNDARRPLGFNSTAAAARFDATVDATVDAESGMREKHSRVNFKKLVTDLADMYQDETFDVVVAELTANALDAGAARIDLEWDAAANTLVITDDGRGMTADEFEQYHDLAAELKTRGDGIGFAGVGAKISFNLAMRVVTETRHNGEARASDWYWGANNALLWRPVAPAHLRVDGTRVAIHFNAGLPNNIDGDYLARVLKRHYLPLFITDFARAYERIKLYSPVARFTVNGRAIEQTDLSSAAALTARDDVTIKLGATAVGWGALGVSRHDCPIDGRRFGVLLCTRAKVIKAETFGLPTGLLGARLYGVFEIPALIDYLTANKSDVRGRGGARQLGKILDASRAAVAKFLQAQGVAIARLQSNPLAGKLEKALERIVRQLPELRDFDGLTPKSRALQNSADGKIAASDLSVEDKGDARYNADAGDDDDGDGVDNTGGEQHQPQQRDAGGKTKTKPRRTRRHQGPRVAFEDHPARAETAWLNADTIVINSGHAAYRNRISHAEARLTYCMFSIGIALDKAEVLQDAGGVSYVDRFVAAWGER